MNRMHSPVLFTVGMVAAYVLYTKLSASSVTSPKVTNTNVQHAHLAANPIITNDAEVVTSARAHTMDLERVVAMLHGTSHV